MSEAIGLRAEVSNKLNNAGLNPIIGHVKQKVNNVLEKKPGYSAMVNIKKYFTRLPQRTMKTVSTEFLVLPVTSCDVERRFL